TFQQPSRQAKELPHSSRCERPIFRIGEKRCSGNIAEIKAEAGQEYQSSNCAANEQYSQRVETASGRQVKHKDPTDRHARNRRADTRCSGESDCNAQENDARTPFFCWSVQRVSHSDAGEYKAKEAPGRENRGVYGGARQQYGRTEAVERQRDVSAGVTKEPPRNPP